MVSPSEYYDSELDPAVEAQMRPVFDIAVIDLSAGGHIEVEDVTGFEIWNSKTGYTSI